MRLTRLAARLYPRWWRERYGEEFAALLEDARPGWRGAVDITQGAVAMQMTTFSGRRVWSLAILAGLLLGYAASFAMNPLYTSSAVLEVSDASTNEEILNKVNAAANAVLSRSALSTMMVTQGLYRDERNRIPLDDVLETMRQHIRLMPVNNVVGNGRAIPAFQISFEYSDRIAAHEVTQLLARSFQQFGAKERDAASLPQIPNEPNRMGFTAVGTLSGVALGGMLYLWRRRKARTGTPQ